MLIQDIFVKKMVTSFLEKGGSNTADAEISADHLVLSNLNGLDCLGVGMLPVYIRMINAYLLIPNHNPKLLKK